ncbi:C2 family cysteine protease [Desmonostoc muscorum LEGE 12446]|uniref:Calpain catalytic domain-containing protein n=1 Tax=Desmonostoc muscorum LEGE 12446 TaxID=1828758 RepID=A0A8J6ZTF0_DESMC|nr:C2 family cysteine protease [Desmonostoc muscorum]MCF2145846.1 C2 family cysteine protease [Desmonostoc muscorum LEGE 12446]
MNDGDNLFDLSFEENSFEQSFDSDSSLHLNSNEQPANTEFYQHENRYEQSFKAESYHPKNHYEQPSNEFSYSQQNDYKQSFNTESYQQQNHYEEPLNEYSYSQQNPYDQSFNTKSYQQQNTYEQPLNEYSYSHQNPYELSLGNESYSQQNSDTSHNPHSNLTQSLKDPGIAHKFSESVSKDGIDRQEMISLMREAKDGGEIDAKELTDLRNIVDKDNLVRMSEDVRILSNKIVNGDPANDHSGIGNLSAGSNAEQMDKLIDKWYLGEGNPELKPIEEPNKDKTPTYPTYQKIKGSLFQYDINIQNDVGIKDVEQGQLGDCYLLAALAAVAEKSPQTIKEMIKDNNDGTYSVRFFREDENGKLIPDYVTVNSELPTIENGKAVYADWGSDPNKHELWVAVVEKAYAQMNESGRLKQENAKNSYVEIQGGYSGDAIEHITGQPSERFDLTSPNNEDENKIISEIKSGEIVTMESKPDLVKNNIVANHAYVVRYNPQNDKFSVHNPWGVQHAELTWDQIKESFSRAWIF